MGTIFSVCVANIRCAFCRNKECEDRFKPKKDRMWGTNQRYNPKKYVSACKSENILNIGKNVYNKY